MQSEYNSLMENNSWTLVSRPKDAKILKCKWVYRIKRNQDGSVNKYKARLVARGDQQREGIDFDEVFAPVARLETIRTLLATSVVKGMYIHQLDVVTAYVQGDLNEDIYMIQPETFQDQNNLEKVCKLNRPLYGLKQAGREWYKKLNNCLLEIGFRNTAINPCTYADSDKTRDTIILVYVDDLLIASADLSNIENIKIKLKQNFKMKDLGNVRDVLGMRVERKGDVGNIKLTQRLYIENVLKRFGMKDCNPTGTPLESNVNEIVRENEPKTNEIMRISEPYRELVGCLMYLANASRPDIAFAANLLSRFNNNPSEIHWKMAKRVLRYLKGTVDCGINYEKKSEYLVAYSDSDWGGDKNDRKSNTGYVVYLAGGPISWASRKQKTVALSTMEAEYMALSDLSKEIIYVRNLLEHIKYYSVLETPTKIYCDNQSAICLSKNSVYHARTKHIDVRHHFTRETQERGDIELEYISTKMMAADALTKCVPKRKHDLCMSLMNIK